VNESVEVHHTVPFGGNSLRYCDGSRYGKRVSRKSKHQRRLDKLKRAARVPFNGRDALRVCDGSRFGRKATLLKKERKE
jgi:hypothetical protein